MKLSESQIKVLTLMKDGYELGFYTGIVGSHASLQKEGLGSGGHTVKVSYATLQTLKKKGLIEKTEVSEFKTQPKFYLTFYRLTQAGIEYLQNTKYKI